MKDMMNKKSYLKTSLHGYIVVYIHVYTHVCHGQQIR